MASENMKVAVRVRAFSQRELTLHNPKCIIEMHDNQTIVKPRPEDEKTKQDRIFAFDYSYWSFDGFKTEPNGYLSPDKSKSDRNYCDQLKIFNDLGTGVLENAWKGYNACIFAYGQTSSGKFEKELKI
jgi:hypothetical protein